MNLRGLVSVSGKPGLYKLIGQNKSGFVLESLDAQKIKLVASLSNSKMASLEEITLFGNDEDIKLYDVFEKMKGAKSIPDPKADGKVLRDFFNEVAPNHDEEKVYSSDIKKVITWFNIIKELPLFNEAAPEPLDAAGAEAKAEDHKKVEKPVQPKLKAPKKTESHATVTRVSQKSK